jgi:uncharacterized protein (DUF608 family)
MTGAVLQIRVAPQDRITMTLALSWFLPGRYWGEQELGHYYQNFYSSSEAVAVAESTTSRLTSVVDSILKWQQLCYDNSLPNSLQDAFVNSASVWGRTSLFTRDGRWRSFESHSCAQMEPPHIHMYRALGYALFLPQLETQVPLCSSFR